MTPQWTRILGNLHSKSNISGDLYLVPCRRNFNIAPLEVKAARFEVKNNFAQSGGDGKARLYLKEKFMSDPCSLALPPSSDGSNRFLPKWMRSKQSNPIHQPEVIYDRVVSRAGEPGIYNVFSLKKNFRTNFLMLVVHMWLCLRRLKDEGKEGIVLSRNVIEIYNDDLKTRVAKAGVDLLPYKSIRELKKVFDGNIAALDTAMLSETKQTKRDNLQNAIWKNIFAEVGSSELDEDALVVKAFTRYIDRECECLLLTAKEAMFSGNFKFTPLEDLKP